MKKFIIVLQILVLLSQNIHANEGTATALVNQTEASVSEVIKPQMPKNYRLPEMMLLDSVAFYNEFKNQVGKRVSVNGYSGRFGATFGEDFKQKIFEVESQFNEKVEIILTLSSTIEDARILKQKMALAGRKMTIVEIPDEVQKRILDKAEAKAAGGLKELWWDTKDKAGKLLHPVKTVTDSAKIVRNQFVKPTAEDVRMTVFTTSITAGTTLMLSVGIDWKFAIAMTAARAFFTGTTTLFRTTINNLYRADITNDLGVTGTWRQTIAKLGTMGVGIGEAYYGIGSTWFSEHYRLTQAQLLSQTITSGLVETLSSTERNNRLSDRANRNMYFNTFVIGSLIGALASIGHVGPMVFESGVVNFFSYDMSAQFSTLQVTSIALYLGLFLSYKYFTDRVERMAQKTMREHLAERARRLMAMRELRAQRQADEIKAKAEATERKAQLRQRMTELLEETRRQNGYRRPYLNYSSATCSNLFR